MSGIFNASIFNNAIFNTGDAALEAVPVIVLGGKGDNDGRKRRRKTLHLPFKPTGIIDRPSKEIEQRVAETREIAAEVAVKISKEFSKDNDARFSEQPSEKISLSASDAEIGELLHKEIQAQEDMDVILILLAACVEARLI